MKGSRLKRTKAWLALAGVSMSVLVSIDRLLGIINSSNQVSKFMDYFSCSSYIIFCMNMANIYCPVLHLLQIRLQPRCKIS